MVKFRELEKRFSNVHVGSFTTGVEEVMEWFFQKP